MDIKVMDNWDELLQEQLGNWYQLLDVNMQIQELYAEKDTDESFDAMVRTAEALPVTIGVGDQLITMSNVAPVNSAMLAMIIRLAREYLIDLPETEEDNAKLRDLAQEKIDELLE